MSDTSFADVFTKSASDSLGVDERAYIDMPQIEVTPKKPLKEGSIKQTILEAMLNPDKSALFSNKEERELHIPKDKFKFLNKQDRKNIKTFYGLLKGVVFMPRDFAERITKLGWAVSLTGEDKQEILDYKKREAQSVVSYMKGWYNDPIIKRRMLQQGYTEDDISYIRNKLNNIKVVAISKDNPEYYEDIRKGDVDIAANPTVGVSAVGGLLNRSYIGAYGEMYNPVKNYKNKLGEFVDLPALVYSEYAGRSPHSWQDVIVSNEFKNTAIHEIQHLLTHKPKYKYKSGDNLEEKALWQDEYIPDDVAKETNKWLVGTELEDIIPDKLANIILSKLYKEGEVAQKIVGEDEEFRRSYNRATPYLTSGRENFSIDYSQDVQEIYSRLFEIRRTLNLRPDQIVTEDMLSSPEMNKSYTLKLLKQAMPLKNVVELLNTLAYQDDKKYSNIA